VQIEYRVYGDKPLAVVLIHGWSCDSRYWRAQVGALAATYTVVTLDLAGHGASGGNRSAWTMQAYGEDVAAVVRHLSNQRVVLVGHSMGGPVALEAAALLGDRVAGVIGVDTFRSIGLPLPPRAQVEHQIEPFRTNFVAAMHAFVPRYLFTPHADASLVRQVTDEMSREPPAVAVASLDSLNALDFSALLPRIHVPILAINSDLGGITDAERIRKSVPGFQVITLPGDGHFLMLEDAQRFNQILQRELATFAASLPR